MNKQLIRTFSVSAHSVLIASVKQKAFEYGITEESASGSEGTAVYGRELTGKERELRQQLADIIRIRGYSEVMEEAAYIWFNRLIALRYMEANCYLPCSMRVFTDANGNFDPELLKNASDAVIVGLDREKAVGYIERGENEELYKYLIITLCNSLGASMP
ncbi:MAG: SAM-dependent methyltransferase, partial [Clostridia bacterium]|nr:SAM-dependent methyltransferase [Clostridia bacterium]